MVSQSVGLPVHYAGIAAFAALLPDLDVATSWIGSRIRGISDIIQFVFGHRGPFHSLLPVIAAMYLLPALIGKPIAALIVGGYVSHLFLDMLTPAGIKLLWPIPWSLSVPVTPTGGILENVVVLPLILAGIYFVV